MRRFEFFLVIFALTLASLACGFNVSTAKLEDVRMAKDEAGNSPTTTFGQEDTFYLLGNLANAPSDTSLKAVWTVVDAQDVDPNTKIDEASLTTGSGTFYFYLENNNPLWPVGRYKVELYMNDKLEQTIEFEVSG